MEKDYEIIKTKDKDGNVIRAEVQMGKDKPTKKSTKNISLT